MWPIKERKGREGKEYVSSLLPLPPPPTPAPQRAPVSVFQFHVALLKSRDAIRSSLPPGEGG